VTDRPTIPDSHKDLLQAAIGLLATNGRNGLPQLTAIPSSTLSELSRPRLEPDKREHPDRVLTKA